VDIVPAGFLNLTEYIEARRRERRHFLVAIERANHEGHFTRTVLVPSLDIRVFEAYCQCASRYEDRFWPDWKLAAMNRYLAIDVVDRLLDKPHVACLRTDLEVWADKFRLNAPWILDAAIETMYFWWWSGSEPTAKWSPPSPGPLAYKEILPDGLIHHPPLAQAVDEPISDFVIRQGKAAEDYVRLTGIGPRFLKHPAKHWHYEALALRLIHWEPLPKLGKQFGVNWRTVKSDIKSAAEIIGIPLPLR
jgi:hypothetical protein